MAEIYRRAGSAKWQCKFLVNGEVVRRTTNLVDPQKAQAYADRLELEAADASALRFLDAAERFFYERTDLKPKTLKEYLRISSVVFDTLGDFVLGHLAEKDLDRYVLTRLNQCKRKGHVMIRGELMFLSSLYKTVRKYDKERIKRNPISDYDMSGLQPAGKRTRYLTYAEFQTMLDACTRDYQKLFVYLLCMTGMREKECRELAWAEVEFDEAQIRLSPARTKTAAGRIVPLPTLLVKLLSSTPSRTQSKWVFENPRTGKPYTNLYKSMRAIRRRAELDDVVWHTMRHTFSTWSQDLGASEVDLMFLMGQKTRSMVGRYTHPTPDMITRGRNRMDGLDF